MKILDGKIVAEVMTQEMIKTLELSKSKPRLDIFLIGDNPASTKYVEVKIKKAKEVGILTELHKYESDADEDIILKDIEELNINDEVNGIMVQLPLPTRFNTNSILNTIDIRKDVDGLGNNNYKNSATANAVISLLDFYRIDVVDKKITVLGSSITVGLPVTQLLIDKGAFVTICNDQTSDIEGKVKEADIVISATGVPGVVNRSNLKNDSIVIDVGFTLLDGKVVGDVNTEGIDEIVSAISPVPGGVGPVTVVSLLNNTILAWKAQNNV